MNNFFLTEGGREWERRGREEIKKEKKEQERKEGEKVERKKKREEEFKLQNEANWLNSGILVVFFFFLKGNKFTRKKYFCKKSYIHLGNYSFALLRPI